MNFIRVRRIKGHALINLDQVTHITNSGMGSNYCVVHCGRGVEIIVNYSVDEFMELL